MFVAQLLKRLLVTKARLFDLENTLPFELVPVDLAFSSYKTSLSRKSVGKLDTTPICIEVLRVVVPPIQRRPVCTSFQSRWCCSL